MPKDDPLGQQRKPAVTLWLEPNSMNQARDNFYARYCDLAGDAPKDEWDLAWAAAVAAFSYLQEGRTSP